MRVVLILLLLTTTSLVLGQTSLPPNNTPNNVPNNTPNAVQNGADSYATSYVATYAATYNGMPIDVTRELIRTENSYVLTVKAKNFLGNILEVEKFHVDARGAVLVDSYTSERRFFGIARKEKLTVDWVRGVALYDAKKKHREIPLAGNYFGPISYQLQMSKDLSAGRDKFCYNVLMRGKVKEYCFEPTGEQVLDTPLGEINTVQMRRIREDQERETLFWLAPQWDYLLVKLWQKEEDGETYEIVLSGAKLDGREPGSPSPR